MKNVVLRLVAIASLALGANVASAIPLTINVTTATGSSAGSWSLSGPSDESGFWAHSIFTAPNTSVWNRNILAGYYTWDLGGVTGLLPATVSWSLSLNGNVFDSGGASGRRFYHFGDDGSFTAVPEPGTLGLLGLGLVGLGLARRRKA